jgi:tRNA-specific adenosine deaminase 1
MCSFGVSISISIHIVTPKFPNHLIWKSTGMKCLPIHKIPHAKGCILHDWHAEVLAIRGLNAFLIQECLDLAKSTEYTSPYLCRRSSDSSRFQPFTLREALRIQMYCSEAPCGDASMELVMNAQEDATPWELPAHDDRTLEETPLRGRGYFSELGRVRRKPCMNCGLIASKS